MEMNAFIFYLEKGCETCSMTLNLLYGHSKSEIRQFAELDTV